jgi:Ca2+-binding EF-hand superfamily protein
MSTRTNSGNIASSTIGAEAEVKEAFDIVAIDGRVTSDGLGRLFRSLGSNLPKLEIDKIISDYDPRKLGYLDFVGFSALYKKQQAWTPAEINEEIEETFRCFDSNHDNYLEPNDLKAAFGTLNFSLTDLDLAAIMKQAAPAKPNKVLLCSLKFFLLKYSVKT